MNPTREADFDARMRQAHTHALAHLSPSTLTALRSARHQAQTAPSRRRWPWLAATAFSAGLAVMIGLQWLPPAATPPATVTSAVTTTDTPLAAGDLFDESPDLYLWLASAEAPSLALESPQ